jgi:hypothetical protein
MVKPPAIGLARMVQVKGRPGARGVWEQIVVIPAAKSSSFILLVYTKNPHLESIFYRYFFSRTKIRRLFFN